jgi:MFS transporter, MFS domain-containing protein family, molybdate-anion transporter
MFIYFDGLVGVYSPLFSSLKSQMIPEKLRTLIMNFFRIPINITSVIILLATNYITTYQVSL